MVIHLRPAVREKYYMAASLSHLSITPYLLSLSLFVARDWDTSCMKFSLFYGNFPWKITWPGTAAGQISFLDESWYGTVFKTEGILYRYDIYGVKCLLSIFDSFKTLKTYLLMQWFLKTEGFGPYSNMADRTRLCWLIH